MVATADAPSDLSKELGKGNPGGYNVSWFDPVNKMATNFNPTQPIQIGMSARENEKKAKEKAAQPK